MKRGLDTVGQTMHTLSHFSMEELRDLITFRDVTECETHDLLLCQCGGSGVLYVVEEQGEVRSLEMVGPAEQLKQALESKRKQELVLSQARQAAGLLEEEAELEKRLEEEGGCSLPGLRRSARVQARAGALLVLHTLEQGVQLQLAAGPAGWEEVYPCTDFEDDKI